MGLLNEASVINIEGNTKQLVDQINKADKAMQNFDQTLTDILSHLTAVENGLKNVNGVTNNFNKTQKGNFFNAQTDTFIGSRGKVASFTSTRTKAYKQAAEDYHKTQLQEIEVMKTQIAKDKKIIQYKDKQIQEYANEVAIKRINANAKYNKTQYLKSAEHLSYEAGLGLKHKNLEGWYAAKSAHPERFLAGALNYSFSHQGARALSGIGDSVRGIGVGGRIAGDILNTAGSFLKAPAAGIMAVFKNLGQEMIDLGRAATQAYAEIESIKTQLGVVFSNQTQANSVFGQISEYAVHSPFGVQQTSELAVLLKQSGVYASDLMDTLRMLGDTAGGNMEKMKRIANNYAQIVSIGKASMLDMRQFAYAGIPIFEAVSKELGVSQQELRKLISDGKVTSDIIEKVFKDLTGINGLFENATEKGAKTLKARLQNLSDARQLAFGQIGEWGVRLGTQTGGDSFVNKLVDIAEKMYEHLKTDVSTVNIEKSVQTIAKRDDNIERYKTLIKFAQGVGSKALEAAFIDKLNKELAKLNPDETRSVYVQSYQNKTRGFSLLNENGVTGTVSSIQQEIDELNQRINSLDSEYWKRQSINEANPEHTLGRILFGKYAARVGDSWFGSAPRGSDEAIQKEALQERVQLLGEILDALKDYNNISDELRRAVKEDAMIQAQQLAFDTTNRNADASTSLNSKFNELASIYENSEEYKQKEEEKKMKLLAEAQSELKKIATKADENGNIRFNEFDRNEFQRLNTAGAFNATKLDIVQGNKQLTAENRAQLESQFVNASGKILEELLGSRAGSSQYGREAIKEFQKNFFGLANITNDEDFFKQFGTALNDMTGALKELEKYNPADAAWLQSLQQYLIQSTNKYESRVKGVNANLEEEEKKGKEKPDFIPLWKRIIASATGWSAERIFSSKGFMDEYQKYASQQISRGGIQGLAGVGGKAGEIGTLLAYTNEKNKQGVHQLDWKKTEENLYNYALKLETPLNKASATMTGLSNAMQNQVETYRKLTADMYTVGEDWTTINNDIKDQYSVAQGLGNKNILDNAFEAMAKESNLFKIGFDDEKGLVVFDKITNKVIGSIDELKANENLNNSDLKAYLQDIHVDNLVSALDKAADETERNAAVTKANADLLSIALDIEKERENHRAKTLGSSSAVIGGILGSNVEGANALAYRNSSSINSKTGEGVVKAFSDFFTKVLEVDRDLLSKDKDIEKVIGDNTKNPGQALGFLQQTLKSGSVEDFSKAVQYFVKQFPEASERIIEEAEKSARALSYDEMLSLADKTLYAENPFNKYRNATNPETGESNKLFEQHIMKLLGSPTSIFADFSKMMTSLAIANPTENEALIGKYQKNVLKLAGKDEGLDAESLAHISQLIDEGKVSELREFLNAIGSSDIWEKATQGANQWAISLGNISKQLDDLLGKMTDTAEAFASEAVTSTFSTWGEALGKGADASQELSANFRQLGAGLLSNLGTMITEAGLSMAIHASSKADVLTGLAIAAAGGGLSFLGGYLNGQAEEDEDKKEEDKYQKLLKIKQDLSDLLKQAREDAIYYENTVRHKKAISANENFTRAVHDAIITPRGDVVTTDPKDYLIATKTPRTLVGSGSPTINFSVIDKSTGIKVTQQRSSYDEATNSIDFEAIIESKVQEVIATSKGDEAFTAREARLNGRTVIA